MRKIIYIFFIYIFSVNILYSYNECGVNYGNCKPGFKCDTLNNRCIADNTQCTKSYGSFSQMQANGTCGCKLGYILYNNKCELFNQVCKNVFGNDSKQGNLLDSSCTCDEGYKFKHTEIKYLNPNGYSRLLHSCVPVNNTGEEVSKNKTDEVNINNLLNNFYNIDIEKLVSQGIISKSNDYKFQNDISRREMLKIMMNLSGKNISQSCYNVFFDLKPSDWGCRYAESAVNFGYIEKNKFFRPNQSISKIEAIKMIFVAKGILVQKTEDWRVGYVNKGVELDLFDNFSDYNSKATRGYIFEIITKIIQSDLLDRDVQEMLEDIFDN